MADVRSLLKSERAARRIQHKFASYSTTGTLLCLVCHLQLKSESLWDGHLRSAGHITRLQKLQEAEDAHQPTTTASTVNGEDSNRKSKASTQGGDGDGHIKKRKASDEDDEDSIRKRPKSREVSPSPVTQELPPPPKPPISAPMEMRIPSRPATPLKPVEEIPKKADVDEDEWAAFEADIAAAEAPSEAVITAPAIPAAELATQPADQSTTTRKERQEAEIEADKEDAARKLEDEFEEMQSLEARVTRMKEKREMLRKKESMVQLIQKPVPATAIENGLGEDNEDGDEDGDEDNWTTFRSMV